MTRFAVRQFTPTRQLWGGAVIALLGLVAATACGSDPAPCSGAECGTSGTSGGTSGGNGSQSGPCSSDASCDGAHGFSCVAGQCRYPCSTHFDCNGLGICDSVKDASGSSLGTYCALMGTPVPAGQYYTRCPNYTECDSANGFACLGAGTGDADAYCSGSCTVDTDCPTGFFCDKTAAATGSTEALYCVRRRFCASCETDADCLTVAGQICAKDQDKNHTGERICTKLCDQNVDSCPWGNATLCNTFDDSVGAPTCAHRFGSCHGEGKSCEPCVRDEDCPLGFCFGSTYTGERWCVDSSVECNCDGLDTTQHICSNGNGCPKTPGKLPMSCYDFSRGEGDPIAHTCFSANTTGSSDLASPQAGCWEAL